MPRKLSITAPPDQCPLTSRCKSTSNIDCTNRNYADCGFFQNEVSEYCKTYLLNPNKTPCKYRAVCRRRCWQRTARTPGVIADV